MENHFFIKAGYQVNPVKSACSDAISKQYWTTERLAQSASLQYDAYRLAAKIAKRRRYRSCLDVGCGPALKTKNLLAPCLSDIYLLDKSECSEIVHEQLPDAHFIAVDLEICDLDLQREFDLIICADVLEHLVNPRPCLNFIKQHLSHNGTAIFSTPERDILRGRDCMHSPHPDHVREWNRREFKLLLESAGFQVQQQLLTPIARLNGAAAILHRLLPAKLQPKQWQACQVVVCSMAKC